MSNLSLSQKGDLISLVKRSLDKAEEHWRNGGHELTESFESVEAFNQRAADSVPSRLPGHGVVSDDETVIDDFIAFVADMRGSSKNLMCKYSEKKTSVKSGLERVFYETSALLPALEMTISFEEGSVTEYLGDGVLAFFRVDRKEREKSIYAAYHAAINSISDTRKIVNEEIRNRYGLPDIDIGVGLAYSKAIVSLSGIDGNKHPKAFGECVYRATKLSSGINEVVVDHRMESLWPTSKGGKLGFRERKFGNISGYCLYKQ